ncbi:MAG: hypothetical protein K2Q34_03670 [Alphaproteobacteria bacterium]|nr:hypothetical protein [Alphaproteobacteria bacterium]
MDKKPYVSMPDYKAYVSNEESAFMKLCLDVQAKMLYFTQIKDLGGNTS